jgi:hypothetical protein
VLLLNVVPLFTGGFSLANFKAVTIRFAHNEI